MHRSATPPVLPAKTHIGSVSLVVGDLGRSIAFYTDVLGLGLLETDDASATVGVGGRPLIRVHELPGATPASASATGLYHLAILVGSRVDLGRSLARLVERGHPLGGASDHLVSEALYLSDPDGNGIELYRDRPRSDWSMTDGKPKIDSLPLDLRGLLDDARAAPRPWTGLADDATLGHVHLQVDDLTTASAFYCDVLGFEVMADMSRMGALFIGAGGYHHHIGLNTWHSRGGSRRPAGTAGLASFVISLPDADSLAALSDRLNAAGYAHDDGQDRISVEDPAGNTVVIDGAPTSTGATT